MAAGFKAGHRMGGGVPGVAQAIVHASWGIMRPSAGSQGGHAGSGMRGVGSSRSGCVEPPDPVLTHLAVVTEHTSPLWAARTPGRSRNKDSIAIFSLIWGVRTTGEALTLRMDRGGWMLISLCGRHAQVRVPNPAKLGSETPHAWVYRSHSAPGCTATRCNICASEERRA